MSTAATPAPSRSLAMSAAPVAGSTGPTPADRRGSLYRGGEGMWSWVAHRITGVLIFFFLFAHVLDTALVRVSPETYNEVIETYKNPFVNLMEVGPGRRRAVPRAQRPAHHAGRLLVARARATSGRCSGASSRSGCW